MPEILSIGELLDLGSPSNSAYIPYSGLEYNASGAISGISGSAIAGGVESSVVSSIVSSMVSGKADQSAVNEYCSAMSAEVSAKLDASASSSFQPLGDYAYESSLSSYLPSSASSNFAPSANYAFASSLSSKLDASASSSFYTTDNPSGFITGVDLSNYATTVYVDSSVSSKMDNSAIQFVAGSSDATANGVLYILTGNI